MFDEWKLEMLKVNDDKSWKLLEKVVFVGVQEQWWVWCWGIFFKLLIFIYFFVVLLVFSLFGSLEKLVLCSGSYMVLIEVKGMIVDDELVSVDNIVMVLCVVFKDEGIKGIVLWINSLGGSLVQFGYIYDEICCLCGEYLNVKVYVVISDLGVFGVYYIVSVVDQIYVDKVSLVGFIGVMVVSFGFVGIMEKFGVEWCVYIFGEYKLFFDFFQL